MRTAAHKAGILFSAEVVPVYVTPTPTAAAPDVLVLDDAAKLDTGDSVLSDQQARGLAARAQVMLTPRPAGTKAPLQPVKPPSRLFGITLVLALLLALAWGIAMLADAVLNQPAA